MRLPRALRAGSPWANSKAVHRASARKAQVIVPPLSAYESQQATDPSREICFLSPTLVPVEAHPAPESSAGSPG